jgi:hypothetical protein
MADFNTLGLSGTDSSGFLTGSQTTTSNISPQFSSVDRVYATALVRDHVISIEPFAIEGWLSGRRPSSGQLYPRGLYNK